MSNSQGGILTREEENEAQVRREDQENINTFGRLNARLHEVRDDYAQCKKTMEQMDDASTELMMGSGENVMLSLGNAFLETSEEEATEHCEQEVERLQKQVDALQSEEEGILSQQGELKKILYTRFGKSINLED